MDCTAGWNPFAVLTAVVAPTNLTNACSVGGDGAGRWLARVVGDASAQIGGCERGG